MENDSAPVPSPILQRYISQQGKMTTGKNGRGAAMLRSAYVCIKPSLRKCEQDVYHTLLHARQPAKLTEYQ